MLSLQRRHGAATAIAELGNDLRLVTRCDLDDPIRQNSLIDNLAIGIEVSSFAEVFEDGYHQLPGIFEMCS